jgi:hypothetical protein
MEYMKIKGKKTKTAKFWPVFLDGWQEQWPKPALSDLVRDEAKAADGNGDTSTVDTSNEAGVEDAIAGEADTDKTDQSTSKKGKKARKPLTVSIVHTTSSVLLRISY